MTLPISLPAPCPGSEVIWIQNASMSIAFHNHKTVNVSSVEMCRILCVQEKDFLCQSADYNKDTKECHLSRFKAAQVGDYFKKFPDRFQYLEWQCQEGRFVLAVWRNTKTVF